MSKILGIDPGMDTGLATFEGGKLVALDTITPLELERTIRAARPDWVIYEDSRLQSRAWNAHSKAAKGAALATARDLGTVDAWCGLIDMICKELGIAAQGISPAAKGPKRAAENFKAYTGWQGRCNQHERDAAMVGWTFRQAAPEKKARAA
ncbi:hypothetical protein [Paracidovorax citrulli]|uniref:Uncharacterized protein n=2 Tax=Paracidovorax citrulli TaxID=80869 RepID=A1TMU3_PARC0|nr:hypothetical protein [Paracidovorax citrulli]ABM32281.1 conserved hypothetical protein [Paracidovorax citrulli AAC00-1]ATG94705.1 hypothetical protein CQB05_12255 [Paracidovorax citrulli]MVT38555.1 hypothetical protein [Paracidovorax citrulli]PVY66481.1 hypothetical protein C8E08_3889 [Paracidovorax citrulli]QCX12156.1 hypothetical protein APS58_3397 [Paracidovorax citrulli]